MDMILMTLIMMNILAISSNSWISLWVMMEMTTYIFLIYSMDRMEMKNKFEFMLTYFLMSFISSTFFLLSFMMQYSNSMNQLTPNFIPGENMIQSTLLTIAFLLKMGSIPFHPWVFSIVENLKWKPMMTMMTIQKIIPIWTLTFFHNQMLILSTILISSVIMMFIPLKTKSLYYFMASSATMNVIWILLSISISPLTTLIYSLIYFFLTISIILVFQKSNVKMMNQNFSSNSMLLAMLSLMGMPPLLGFIPKFNTMINSIQMSQEIMLLMILLVMANSINTIMYMKPMIPMMLSSHSHLTTSSIMMKNVDMVTWISHLSWPILGMIIYNLN